MRNAVRYKGQLSTDNRLPVWTRLCCDIFTWAQTGSALHDNALWTLQQQVGIHRSVVSMMQWTAPSHDSCCNIGSRQVAYLW